MWSQNYSASHNAHFDFPPVMSDGRIYSSYQPQAVVNDNLRARENIHSNWDYRRYLQTHADEVVRFNSMDAQSALGLPVRPNIDITSTSNVPFTFKTTSDLSRPSFGYCNSDLKNPYMSREQLQARLVAPSINSMN